MTGYHKKWNFHTIEMTDPRMREVLEQIRDSGAPHPVNLDDVWQACGFHTKATAKQGLKGLDKAEVILDAPTPRKAGQTGRPPKVTLMTLAAFEHLCTMKPAGAEVWKHYKELSATPRGPAAPAAPAGPAPVPALVAVSAQSTPAVFDDSRRLEIKKLFDAANSSTESHPINFDDAWRICGYTRGDNAKRALKGPGIDGEIISLKPEEGSRFNKNPPKRGPVPETILMTVRGFKHFCLKAPGALGAQVRDYYISLEEVANAAIAVAQDVASGEVTVTATSAGGLKRLRTLEEAINANAKRVKSFTSEQTVSHGAALDYEKVIRDVQTQFASEMEAIEEERNERVENALAVRRNREFYYGSLAKERREAAYAAQEKLKLEQQLYSANLAELEELKKQMATSDANFKKVKAELEVEMRDKLNVWLRVQELNGVVFSEDMVAAL